MSEQRLENGPKAMRGPEAAASNPSSAHEAARFIATVSLSLGALMLSLFGIIERMVTFEKLAVRVRPAGAPAGDRHTRLSGLRPRDLLDDQLHDFCSVARRLS